MSPEKAYEDTDLMPYGKFKGQKLANVPAWHLVWLFDQPWCKGSLYRYISNNIEDLRKEAAK